MKISDLKSAKEMNNRKYLEKQFEAARRAIEAGETVRVEQEFSDKRIETVHVINDLDELKHFKKKYID